MTEHMVSQVRPMRCRTWKVSQGLASSVIETWTAQPGLEKSSSAAVLVSVVDDPSTLASLWVWHHSGEWKGS